MISSTLRILFVCLLLISSSDTYAQSPPPTNGESFRFVRIRYDSNTNFSYNRWGPWAYDWPTAEQNLHLAIERTTRIPLAGDPIVLTLQDDQIFEYPILYLCEPGYWLINNEEIENLREYIYRGGFLMIDDFHDYGDDQLGAEWENFYMNITQVFPDWELVELDTSHPVWSIFYDIDPEAALSTKAISGEVPWLDADDDTYYGMFTPDGRLAIIICYNQDIGDGWEWPGRNMGEASTVSFQMAINFIMYALSH